MVLESNTLDVLFVKDGQQGEDGKILYTWIKYAKDANGTGMTDDPNGAVYIGISYNNESSTESNDPTQYAWTKIQGADGKKGEDAYTIFLENENISFATDENRDPLSEQAYTSGITIMKGAKPVTDFIIGDIAKTQGIAVAKTDTAIAISVINGNPLPSDNGAIEIPITVGGTVFKKILSWTCSKKGDQGIQGPQGIQGEKGKDGTSVTITNKSITYQLSASGTVVPTGTWQTSPQTIPEGQYQWTKTSVTYSDGNKTESYSISYRGKNGSDGTSVKTTSTSVKYQVGDSGTTKPTGAWQNSVPTVAQGKYLWTQTIVNYSDGNSTESYSVSYKGIDGNNGVNGMNAATIYLYQRATSTPSKPSNTLTYTFSTTKITGTLNNGWSTAIPTGTDAVYVTVASVSSKNDTATIATSAWSAPVVLAQNGKTGSDGKAGLNVATIYLYQRNTSKPSKPSASVTYTFSTGVASGLNNGWSQKIPDGTNPLYVTLATASSNTATDTILSSEWSDVVVMAQNGEDGQDGISPKVTLSKSGDTTTISIVDATGTHTQTVKDGTNGTPGAAGKDGKTSYFHVKYSNDGGKTFTGNSGEDTGIYMGSYTDYTEADSTDVGKYTWIKVKGDKGDTGQKGQDGTSIKITSKSVTYQTSTSGTTAPTGTWSTSVPTVNNGQYLWTKTTVQYSDGNKTEAYSVSYKGTNGTNGTSVTVSKTEVTYQVSTSGTTAPTGTWSTTMPTCDQGLYLWTKTYVKYSDGKDTTSYSVSYKGVDGDNFSWNLIKYGKGDVKKGFFKAFNKVENGYGELTLTSKKSYQGLYISDGFEVPIQNYPVGSKLIWSYDIMYTKWDFPTGTNHQEFWLGQRYTNAPSGETATGQWKAVTSHSLPVVGQNGCELNKWLHVEAKVAVPEKASDNVGTEQKFQFYNSGDATATVTLRMKNVKLEYGDTATPWSPAQSDLEGRGVSETVQYYLATSQASGVTSSTSGWSTDITTQKLTADKKYLWNCYQTKYSDGTSEPISTPKVIGVYGDKGQKGENAKNLSITPSSQYFKSTDGSKTFAPNTITIKPTIQGEISFGKWQYSIDGGVSFADVVSGQKGLTVSNNVLTVSKDSSLYSDAVTMVTFRAVASDSGFYDTCSIAKIYDVSDIGDGRNLLTGVSSYTKDAPFEKTDSRADGWIVYQNIITSIELEAGKKYVLQAKTDGNWTANHDTNGQDPSKKLVSLWLCSDTTNDFFDMRQGYVVFTPTVTAKYKLRVNQYSNGTDDYTIRLWDIKLEKGSSPTGWTPAPEDVQTAILSTKSEISDVSLKVDNNKQAIEQRVEKTTYQQDLKLVKGDISKANEGLNKWRYEIYPKSLFTSEYQGKSTMDVFAKNTNLTPSQSVLINDTDFGKNWAYGDNYIGYALTFVKFSAAKSVAITFKHDDGAHLYLNGKLIGGDDTCNTGSGESLTLSFIQGWNCLEVVLNEKSGGEYIGLGTTISAISECQLMNCYYGTPVARQSHITNQLVQNTTDIDGVSGSVQKVMSTVGDSGKIDEFVSNYATWKKKVDGIETRVGETYTTKDDFDDLQIGGRNLLKHSSMIGEKLICDADFYCNSCDTKEYTNEGFHIVTPSDGNANNGIAFGFDNFTILGINGGDTITFSCDIKGTSDSHAPFVSIHISDNNWYGSDVVQKNTNVNITKDWQRVSVTITTPTGLTKNHMWLAIHGNYQSDLYVRNFKLEKGNKATDWTPAPEDVNGKIVNVETIANQTAKKFEWIVKGESTSSNLALTDNALTAIANNINLTGKVTFNSFDQSLKDTINNKTNVSYLSLSSGGNNQACWKIATIKISGNYTNQDIIIGVNHRGHGYTECRIQFKNAGNPDPGLASFRQTGLPSKCWRIIKTANSTWELYLYKNESWDGGYVVKYINPYHTTGNVSVTWSGENADLPSGTTTTEQMIADQTTIDGGIITTGYISADRIAAGSITADKIDVANLFAQDITATGTIRGVTLAGVQGEIGGWSILDDMLGMNTFNWMSLGSPPKATETMYNAYSVYHGKYSPGVQVAISASKYVDAYLYGYKVTVDEPTYITESFQLQPHEINIARSYYQVGTHNSSADSQNETSYPNYVNEMSLSDKVLSFHTEYRDYENDTLNPVTPISSEIKNFTSGLYISSNRYLNLHSPEFITLVGKTNITESLVVKNDINGYKGMYIKGLTKFESSDTSTQNAIETIGDAIIGGKLKASSIATQNGGLIETSGTVYGGGEIQCGGNQVRIISGNIGCMLRNDSADFYILRTNAGDPYGDWTNDRPFRINWATNDITCGHNLTANDLIANGWIYNASGGHYTWKDREDAYISCGDYNGHNVYYYANYHAFYVNADSGNGMMYINTNGVTSRVGFTKTSDERIKKNFESFDDNIIDAYMNIEPVKYQLKQSSNDNYHFGFKAQHVDKVFSDYGDIYNESFDICTSRPIDPDKAKELYGVDGMVEEYGLRYDELIAPTTYMVQHIYKELESTKGELAKVKQEKTDLETRLQAIEAKLGLHERINN